MYQVYPRSFQDANGDGTGDIKGKKFNMTFCFLLNTVWLVEFYSTYKSTFFFNLGIQSRLSHIKDLGAETIWISPIYKSPMVDFGYDISDFVDIDETFGTLKDFSELVASAHDLGECFL